MEIFIDTTSKSKEPSVIIWQKDRILKWSDFKKKPEPRPEASAVSAVGFQSGPFVEHIKIGSKFKFRIKEMNLNTIFMPDCSWVVKGITKENRILLLKHEQGHFDLAEEITRKARVRTTNRLRNRIFNIRGKNEIKAKKDALLRVSRIRKKIAARLNKELTNQEAKYDDKTNHGLIVRHQKKYNKRFDKLRR